MKNILVACLLLLSVRVFAQTAQLSGYLKDATTGETLIGATVYLPDSGAGTVTNEYGFYSFQVSTEVINVNYSYIGYQTVNKELTITADTQLTVELSPEDNAIEGVEIVYDENERKLQTAEMSVNTLSSEVIKRVPAVMGEVDLVKSIQLLPGVSNNGEGANGFNVRGGSEDQNLVLLDEAIIYNSAHVLGFFSVFNNDAVKDVKLYKGGIPSKFGGRISSVLDVRQKDGNDKSFSARGGLGLISSRLMLEGPLQKDKSSFLLAGRSSYVNGFLKLAENPNRLGFYDLNAKASWELNDNNELFLSGYFGNDTFKLADFFKNTYGNQTANLRWNHVYSNDLFSNLSVIYSKYNYNLDFTTLDFEWDSGIENTNLKYDMQYYASPTIDLNFGVSAIGYNFNPGEIKPTNEDSAINELELDKKRAFEGGVYASANHDISDKLSAEYGIRYSNFYRLGGQTLQQYENQGVQYDEQQGIYTSATPIGEKEYKKSDVIKSFHNLEPRVAVSYKATDDIALKASYNRTAQYIHLISNTTTPTPLDIWAPSGEFFEPQLANQYAVGVFKSFDNNAYTVELEGYYKTVDNRIDYIDGSDLVGANEIEQETLVGEMRSFGSELMVQKTQGALTGWLSYTLAKAEQRTPGGAVGGLGLNDGNWYYANFDRTHDLSLTGMYELNDKWSFASTFVFQTGRPITYPDGQYIYQGLSVANYAPRNSNRLTPYHRLDLSATLTPRKNASRKFDGEWVFGVYNAYDRRNANSISFQQNFETRQNEATRTAIFGIVPAVTYNFKFN